MCMFHPYGKKKPSRKYSIIRKLLTDEGAWLYYTSMIELQADFAIEIQKGRIELERIC